VALIGITHTFLFSSPDYLELFPLHGIFFVERQFKKTLLTNVNDYGFAKVGVKLLNVETPVTRKAIREVSSR
jgi:hypothetical protein